MRGSDRRKQLASEMKRYGIHPIPNRPVRVIAEVPPAYIGWIRTTDVYRVRKAG